MRRLTHKTEIPYILEIAKRLGRSIAGDLGADAMIELLLAYALALLPNFFDNPKVRIVQHVLFYWLKAFYKSTLLWVFSETIPEDLGVVDISAMSRESIFGSTDKFGNPIKPAFAGKSFVVITELTSFLGSGWAMRDIANTMNVALEAQLVARCLLKLAQMDSSRVQNQVIELKKDGVDWNPKEGVMSYTPHFSALVASRPLDNKYFAFLSQSGFLDRFHVLSHEFDEHEVVEDWHKHRTLDEEALNHLKDFNERIAKVKVHNVVMPSEGFMKPVYDDLESIVNDEITANPSLKKEEILNPRTRGDVIRELVGHAFMRTVCENGFQDIFFLEYTDTDRVFIRKRLEHFFEFKVNPIFVEEHMERVGKMRPKDHTKSGILEVLKDGKEHDCDEIERRLNQMGMNFSSQTLYNAFNDLIDEGKIERTRQGFYRILGSENSG